MRHIVIAARTSLSDLEAVAAQVDPDYRILYESDCLKRDRLTADVFIVVGSQLLRAAAPVLPASSTAIVISDPVLMGCFGMEQETRPGYFWLDFEHDGRRFASYEVDLDGAVQFISDIRQVYRDGEAVMHPDTDDFVEKMLQRAGADIVFIEALTGFSYQPKKTDAERKEYRRRFLSWLIGSQGTDRLSELLVEYSGKRADSAGIRRILENFEVNGAVIRRAVSKVLADAKKGGSDVRRIAEDNGMSVFELNYFLNACRITGLLG